MMVESMLVFAEREGGCFAGGEKKKLRDMTLNEEGGGLVTRRLREGLEKKLEISTPPPPKNLAFLFPKKKKPPPLTLRI